MKLYKCDQLIYGARVWKLSLINTKMPLNYIIINYYCLENVNEFSLTAILQFITELNLNNSEYSATSGDFSRKRRELLSFSLLNPLLFSITLYTTTLSTALLLYYYYCEYWMLDHITRLYAVDMCTNWVVLGSFIIESEQKIFFYQRKFTIKFERSQHFCILKLLSFKTHIKLLLWFMTFHENLNSAQWCVF